MPALEELLFALEELDDFEVDELDELDADFELDVLDDFAELELVELELALADVLWEFELLEAGLSSPPITATNKRVARTAPATMSATTGVAMPGSFLAVLPDPRSGGLGGLSPESAGFTSGSTGAPHAAQKLSSSRNCLPHFEQNIVAPFARRLTDIIPLTKR